MKSLTVLPKFLDAHCSRFFDQYGFKVLDSGVGEHAAAGEWLLLESKDIQIHISYERDEVLIFICSLHEKRKHRWYTLDRIGKLLGQETPVGVKDDVGFKFLALNIDEIVKRFEQKNFAATAEVLDKIKAKL